MAIAACGGPAASPTPAPSIPSDAIPISAIQYAFEPEAVATSSGPVTFAVTNNGTENHEFEIMSGETSLGRIDSFGVGATATLTVSLEPGEYEFVCRLNGHDILGMKGQLTVGG